MPSSLPSDVLDRIAPFCSSRDGAVFALHGLPEEVIAVLFAYYSRSKDDLRENLARLIADQDLSVGNVTTHAAGSSDAEEKARAFHEKWVVGYGHASVAEHANVHLAVERISILCAKAIEDLRLGSYTEKSTRYVQFSRDSFVPAASSCPTLSPTLQELHDETCAHLFDVYLSLFPEVEAGLRTHIARAEGQTERGYATAIHAQACDLLRGLLPAGTRTNLGLTANARSLAGLLCKMLASPLAEVRDVASQMHLASKTIAPTLVKHVAASQHRIDLSAALRTTIASELSQHRTQPRTASMVRGNHVRKVRVEGEALARVAAALAYETHRDSAAVEALPTASQIAIVDAAMKTRGRFDGAPRALEAAGLTVELTVDYGAFRDLQRHRMLTQQVRLLGCELGAECPDDLATLGVRAPFLAALERASQAWYQIARADRDAAQYVVPLAYRVETLWTLNLRELVHVIELRSARQGHPSYRKMAQRLFDITKDQYPWLAPHVRVDLAERHALTREVK